MIRVDAFIGCVVRVGFASSAFLTLVAGLCIIRSSWSSGVFIRTVFPLSSRNFDCNSSNALTMGMIAICMKCMSLHLMKQELFLSVTLDSSISDHSPDFILLYHEHLQELA